MNFIDNVSIFNLINFFSELSAGELIFIGLAFLFLFEQIFYLSLGSYPYRYGILVRTYSVPTVEYTALHNDNERYRRISIKIDKKRREIYIRYKHHIGGGPRLFIGQIQSNKINKLKVRVGPLSAIFFSFLLIIPFFQKDISAMDMIFSSLIFVIIIYCFFTRFIKSYRKAFKINDL